MEKKTNKAKLEIFKFLRKSVLSQGYSQKNRKMNNFDKIGGNYENQFYRKAIAYDKIRVNLLYQQILQK